MSMVSSENDLRKSIFRMNHKYRSFSYEVPTLRTQASKGGIGWGLE